MTDNNNHPVLVIGGGISGIVCALELNRLGVPVTLIEKEASLGGLASHFCCKASAACNKCFACVVDKKLKEINGQSQIPQFTGAEITGVAGDRGSYKVSFTKADRVSNLEAAAIVVAAGIDPFDASGKGEYGYGVIKNVVTARDLEEMLRFKGKIYRPSDGKLPQNIAFIQCVGSRDESIGNPYCSHVCCAYALRLIRAIRHQYPEINAAFLYMDIQPAGASFHDFLSACREDKRLRFITSIPSRVYHSPVTEDLRVRLADTERGEVVEEPFDMVVLSVGMVLKKEAKTLANLLGLGLNEEGFLAAPAPGKGIFVTGACAGPKDIDRSITHAKSTAASVHNFLQGR
jgi:heterodisulfide reductase subunit A